MNTLTSNKDQVTIDQVIQQAYHEDHNKITEQYKLLTDLLIKMPSDMRKSISIKYQESKTNKETNVTGKGFLEGLDVKTLQDIDATVKNTIVNKNNDWILFKTDIQQLNNHVKEINASLKEILEQGNIEILLKHIINILDDENKYLTSLKTNEIALITELLKEEADSKAKIKLATDINNESGQKLRKIIVDRIINIIIKKTDNFFMKKTDFKQTEFKKSKPTISVFNKKKDREEIEINNAIFQNTYVNLTIKNVQGNNIIKIIQLLCNTIKTELDNVKTNKTNDELLKELRSENSEQKK